MESLRNIRSNFECSSKKMYSNSIDLIVNKIFLISYSFVERILKEYLKGYLNLCFRCFLSIEDKIEFKLFVEELFKGIFNL